MTVALRGPHGGNALVHLDGAWCSLSRHQIRASALTLLMPEVFADHHDATVPANHLALVADLLNARLNLHDFLQSLDRI